MSVLVVGSLHLDVIVRADRLPRPDETRRGASVSYRPGGKGGNQAIAAARMGARVAMIGRVGQDAFGAQLRQALIVAGVDCAGVTTDAGASGMSVAILQADGTYGAVIVSEANLRIDPADIQLPPGARSLVLQNEVPDAVNLAAAQTARRAGLRVVLNAAPARPVAPALMALVDILVVNRIEAGDMLGRAELGDPLQAAAQLARLGPAVVIVTLGGQGVVLCAGAEVQALPAFPVSVISTHGAGDSFVGALVAALEAQMPLVSAVGFAQAAAALHVSLPEAARDTLSPEMVRAFWDARAPQSR